ncbi:MAG: DUF2157 domain-containing protein [Azoarcus sp.]|jgi:uncharacterized membrane protein|nr:DUF2157 domain-containing protein [Azoarcus sp.]
MSLVPSHRNTLLAWAEEGALTPEQTVRALALTGVIPSRNDWRDFLDRLLLALGVGLLASGLIFFIAYNWEAMGRFVRFALAEGAILFALGAVWRLGLDRPAGKAALFICCVLSGGLLALVGIVYQTGADTWELFATWAVLMLPWALVGRMEALWLLWVAVFNTAAALWLKTGSSFGFEACGWALFVLLTVELAVWDAAALGFGRPWLGSRWGARLLVFAGTFVVSVMVMSTEFNIVAPLVWAVWLLALWFVYGKWKKDVFMLACGVFSVVTVLPSLLLRDADFDMGGLFLWGGLMLVLSAFGGVWLKNIANEASRGETQ